MARVMEESRRAGDRERRRRRRDRAGVQLDRRGRAVQGPRDEPARQPGRDRDDAAWSSGKTDAEKWAKILATHEAFAGRKLEVNQEVYKSEAETNQRNQAIGMLMYAYGLIQDDPDDGHRPLHAAVLDQRLREGPGDDGARRSPTAARTRSRRSRSSTAEHVPEHPRGDGDGRPLRRLRASGSSTTGLPAKSGVGGGLIAVSPGKFGIARLLAAARRGRQQRARAARDRRRRARSSARTRTRQAALRRSLTVARCDRCAAASSRVAPRGRPPRGARRAATLRCSTTPTST